ncbi:hypothetical protein RGQ29_026737 [Quercus rubra]|uniref:Uncharacterized protein n=1 Tax=Quercus rubra TaxID=3512 RepID=A0AAN7EM78_QUERU|nr:hypothetical protein RGQ29_026737 [Quercus rubra]
MSCLLLQLSLGLSASLSFLISRASNHHHDLAVLLRLSHRVLSPRVEESNLVPVRSLIDWILSYVVDVADPDNMKISSSEHYYLLSKPSLSGIPLPVPGNKIDKPGVLSKQALISVN